MPNFGVVMLLRYAKNKSFLTSAPVVLIVDLNSPCDLFKGQLEITECLGVESNRSHTYIWCQ